MRMAAPPAATWQYTKIELTLPDEFARPLEEWFNAVRLGRTHDSKAVTIQLVAGSKQRPVLTLTGHAMPVAFRQAGPATASARPVSQLELAVDQWQAQP